MAEPCQPLAQFVGERIVDVEPVFLRGDAEQLAVQRVEPPQLCDRALVVVHAQVDDRVREPRVAGVLLHDQKRGRLLSSPVASCRLRRGEALDQPLRQLEVRVGLERRGEGVDRRRRDEDVSLGGVAVARAAAGPLVAFLAGERGRTPAAVDHTDLPLGAAAVR